MAAEDKGTGAALAGAAPIANRETDSITRAITAMGLASLTVIMSFALSLTRQLYSAFQRQHSANHDLISKDTRCG